MDSYPRSYGYQRSREPSLERSNHYHRSREPSQERSYRHHRNREPSLDRQYYDNEYDEYPYQGHGRSHGVEERRSSLNYLPNGIGEERRGSLQSMDHYNSHPEGGRHSREGRSRSKHRHHRDRQERSHSRTPPPTNDTSDEDQEALKIGLMVSRQEAAHHTNMFDNLSKTDEPAVNALMEQGMARFDAMNSVFEAKMALLKTKAPAVSEGIRRQSTMSSMSLAPSEDTGGKRSKGLTKQKSMMIDAANRAALEEGLRISMGGNTPPPAIISPHGSGSNLLHQTTTNGRELHRERSFKSNTSSPAPRRKESRRSSFNDAVVMKVESEEPEWVGHSNHLSPLTSNSNAQLYKSASATANSFHAKPDYEGRQAYSAPPTSKARAPAPLAKGGSNPELNGSRQSSIFRASSFGTQQTIESSLGPSISMDSADHPSGPAQGLEPEGILQRMNSSNSIPRAPQQGQISPKLTQNVVPPNYPGYPNQPLAHYQPGYAPPGYPQPLPTHPGVPPPYQYPPQFPPYQAGPYPGYYPPPAYQTPYQYPSPGYPGGPAPGYPYPPPPHSYPQYGYPPPQYQQSPQFPPQLPPHEQNLPPTHQQQRTPPPEQQHQGQQSNQLIEPQTLDYTPPNSQEQPNHERSPLGPEHSHHQYHYPGSNYPTQYPYQTTEQNQQIQQQNGRSPPPESVKTTESVTMNEVKQNPIKPVHTVTRLHSRSSSNNSLSLSTVADIALNSSIVEAGKNAVSDQKPVGSSPGKTLPPKIPVRMQPVRLKSRVFERADSSSNSFRLMRSKTESTAGSTVFPDFEDSSQDESSYGGKGPPSQASQELNQQQAYKNQQPGYNNNPQGYNNQQSGYFNYPQGLNNIQQGNTNNQQGYYNNQQGYRNNQPGLHYLRSQVL